MQRIWVQICGKNRYKVTILIMHKRMRANWVFIDMINGGLLSLLTRFDNGVFNEGGGLRFRLHVYRANNQTRYKFICNAQTHDQYCNGDVLGHNVGTIPFKRSGMQSHLQMHSQFEFKLKPYGQMLLFNQFKLVKHETRVHIHNPCIFMIILDILYASFGVEMN